MAKGRLLNQNVCISGRMDALRDDTTRLFATWTIPWLDKNGVFHATPQIVRAHIFPLKDDMTAAHVAAMLGDMERAGLIVRFESGGRMWQAWPGFAHNQPNLRGERERTEYPAPPSTLTVARENPAVDGQLPDVRGEKPAELNLTKHNLTERGGAPPAADADEEAPDPGPIPFSDPPPDPFTKAARDAGIGSQPSPRSKAAKQIAAAKFDLGTLEDAPAIKVHRDVCGYTPMTGQVANRIISEVDGTAETAWRTELRFWMGKGYRPDNYDGQLRYHATEAKRAQARTPTTPAGKTVSDDVYAAIRAKIEATI